MTYIKFKKLKMKDGRFNGADFQAITRPPAADMEEIIQHLTLTKVDGLSPHVDFTRAFNRLTIHLIISCEQKPESKTHSYFKKVYPRIIDPGDDIVQTWEEAERGWTDGFQATGVVWGGSGADEGVTIYGYKKLRTGMVLNLTGPFLKFETESQPYAFEKELHQDIIDIEKEASAFLQREKHSNAVQLELAFQ